jgi:hypothetical protein
VKIDEAKAIESPFDMEAGTLTLPAGERGRKPSEGATTEEIAERLAALRK